MLGVKALGGGVPGRAIGIGVPSDSGMEGEICPHGR